MVNCWISCWRRTKCARCGIIICLPNKGRTVKSIRKAFLNACKQAGITNFRFHDLRHTFNTNMRKAGVPQAVIMKMTGHKTAAMFHRYNTVDIDDGWEAYRKLEEHLRQERQPVKPGKSSTGA